MALADNLASPLKRHAQSELKIKKHPGLVYLLSGLCVRAIMASYIFLTNSPIISRVFLHCAAAHQLFHWQI